MIRIGPEDFTVEELVREAKNPMAGAVVVFLGTVRSESGASKVKGLFLEAYKEMAERQLAEMVEAAKRRFGILGASIVHRTGTLSVGENILGIAVCAAGRKAAYEASQFLLEELKRTATIWKKEITEEGETWVEGEVANHGS